MINLRYASRQLRNNPTFTLVAVLSLALGIGATSGMFSAADALLLRPLPVPRPANVVHIENFSPSNSHQSMSRQDFEDFHQRNRSFSSLFAYTDTTVSYKRQAASLAHLASGLLVSGSFFEDLQVVPVLGRAFRPAENAVPGRDPVVILSHQFWLAEFNGNPSALGQRMRLNGVEFTIIGVAPQTFTGMDQFLHPQFFVPLAMAGSLGYEKLWDDRGARDLQVKGRLKPGVSVLGAQADLASLASSLGKAYPKTNRSESVRVTTELRFRLEDQPEDATLVIMLMLLAVCVLIVACANVAGLLMSRARARSKEIALRLAIGASRKQLVGQLLLESVLVSLLGGLGGVAIGYCCVQYFAEIAIPGDLPMGPTFQMDARMLAFTLLVSLLTTVLFGLLPALRNTRVDLVPSLKAADADQKGKQTLWGRNGLVIAQVAISMLLLVVTGLLFQGFTHILGAGPGFRTDRLLMLSFNPSLVQYTPEQTRLFYRRLVDEAERVPGVQSAALTYVIPMGVSQHGEQFVPENYQLAPGQDSISVSANVVGPRYFDTMGIPIVSGRAFTPSDKTDSLRVAVVNEVIAHKYFAGRNAIGQRIRLGDSSSPWVRIIGVAKTSKVFWIGEAPQEFLYLPYSQNPKDSMTLLLYSQSDASALAASLRKVISRIDSNQPVFDVRTMAFFYSKRAVLSTHILLNSVAVLGGMGLFLSMVGLYGLVAFSASRRKREIGLRMALGAEKSQVLLMVLKQGLILAGSGIVFGGILAFAVRPSLTSFMNYGPDRAGLLLTGLVGIAMLIITLLATFAPAHRASVIDPMRALRDE